MRILLIIIATMIWSSFITSLVVNKFFFKETASISYINFTYDRKDVLFLRIPKFTPNIHEQIKFKLEDHKNPDVIIFDLRSNPGGKTKESIKIANMFIDKGLLFIKKDEEYYASKETTIDKNAHIIFLVNKGTASSSEVLIRSLMYYRNNTIIGTKTSGSTRIHRDTKYFGILIRDFTIGYWKTPNRELNKPIKPDIFASSNHFDHALRYIRNFK